MATTKQVAAAKRNIKSAQKAAARKRTIAHLPEATTRRDLVKQAQRGRRRGGAAGHALEDRNRQQLYDLARELDIPGRSKLGKWELIRAIRNAQ